MNVLMTTDTVGGVWTYALELTRALNGRGVQVALATMGAPLNANQRNELHAFPDLPLFESNFKLEWMPDAWDDVARAGEWLLKLEQELAPDVIHLNGCAHGALPFHAPKLVVGHSCVCSWWQAVRQEAAPPDWERYRQEVGAGLRAAHRVAAPTQAMLDALQQHYGPLPRTTVAPNARDARRFPVCRKEPFILTAGRLWDEAKNLFLLERAALAVPWPIYVAGEQQHPDGGSVATQSVRPLGRLSPDVLAGWMGRASIYALPALYEPFGLSILEAGLAGCALVLGDIPSLREVWGNAACFVAPDDPDALAAALNALADAPEQRRKMASRARQRAFEYSPERMANAYLDIYRKLQPPAESFSNPGE